MKKESILILSIILMFIASGCVLEERFEIQDTSQIEQFIFVETNNQRALHNLAPLAWNEKLATVAKEHSLDMVERNYLSHINPEDETPTDRAVRHGIPEKKPIGGGFYLLGIGENIGEISPGEIANLGGMYVENTPQGLAKAQVTLWMNSQEHRENILNANYTEIGIGTAHNNTSYITTQNFR